MSASSGSKDLYDKSFLSRLEIEKMREWRVEVGNFLSTRQLKGDKLDSPLRHTLYFYFSQLWGKPVWQQPVQGMYWSEGRHVTDAPPHICIVCSAYIWTSLIICEEVGVVFEVLPWREWDISPGSESLDLQRFCAGDKGNVWRIFFSAVSIKCTITTAENKEYSLY